MSGNLTPLAVIAPAAILRFELILRQVRRPLETSNGALIWPVQTALDDLHLLRFQRLSE